MEKFTLVPRAFFNASEPSQLLSQLVHLEKDDKIEYIELPEYEAVLVYCNTMPAVYRLICALTGISDSNRMVLQYDGSLLSLVIAQGGRLLMANSFEAPGFTTALYYAVGALGQFGIKPADVVVRYSGNLESEWQETLQRYFKDIEKLA